MDFFENIIILTCGLLLGFLLFFGYKFLMNKFSLKKRIEKFEAKKTQYYDKWSKELTQK